MQTCRLSQYYVGAANDDDRIAEEINCTAVNGSAARYCAALRDKCAAGLKARETPGSTGR